MPAIRTSLAASARHGLLRPLAAVAHRAIIAAELAGVGALDRARPAAGLGAAAAELTVLVKTHERPRVARRLVASVRRHEPDVRMVVVDDSRTPLELAGADVIALPYDAGVSAGKRAGLAEIRTPFVLAVDDDFVIYRNTGLAEALALMKDHPEIDIMGGQVIDLPAWSRRTYERVPLFPTAAEPLRPPGSLVGGLPVRDKVANFFLARTERVRLVDWDPQLKRVDHADFFTRARGVLLSVENERLRALHARTPFDAAYQRSRLDTAADFEVIDRRWYATPPDR